MGFLTIGDTRASSFYPETMAISPAFTSKFRSELLAWFKEYGRKLPWRGTDNPYYIWVSEIILQQTQVKQGWDYYLRFIETFPDVKALAEADEEVLLRVWQGLGYYSRAHNMRRAAIQIMEEYGGRFPKTADDIAKLKGIGPYTTAAIGSIAFGLPLAVVDGNVYRVLSRLLADETPIDTTEGKKHYAAIASELLAPEAPSRYNQAIMDFGAMVCTPKNPSCGACPLSEICLSFDTELPELLPIKARKTAVKEEELHFYLLQKGSHIAVEKRDKTGIWKGLYQFPILKEAPADWQETETFKLKDHRLTHRLLHITVHHCRPKTGAGSAVKAEGSDRDGKSVLPYSFIPIQEHHKLAFPKPLRHFLDTRFPPDK